MLGGLLLGLQEKRPEKKMHRAIGVILQADLHVSSEGKMQAEDIIVEYADERGETRRDSFGCVCDAKKMSRVPQIGAKVHVVWEKGTDPAAGKLELCVS